MFVFLTFMCLKPDKWTIFTYQRSSACLLLQKGVYPEKREHILCWPIKNQRPFKPFCLFGFVSSSFLFLFLFLFFCLFVCFVSFLFRFLFLFWLFLFVWLVGCFYSKETAFSENWGVCCFYPEGPVQHAAILSLHTVLLNLVCVCASYVRTLARIFASDIFQIRWVEEKRARNTLLVFGFDRSWEEGRMGAGWVGGWVSGDTGGGGGVKWWQVGG